MAPGSAEELASQLLRRGGRVAMKARGGSMVPFLLDGDLVHVSSASIEEIRIGDVVCYEKPAGRLFLHRVIERRGPRLLTKGDAVAFSDLVGSRALLGRAVAFERRGRRRRLDTRIARARNRVIVVLSPVIPVLLAPAISARRLWRARWAS